MPVNTQLLRDVTGLRNGSIIHAVCEAHGRDGPTRPKLVSGQAPTKTNFTEGDHVVVRGVGPAVVNRIGWIQKTGVGNGGYVKQQQITYLEGANATGKVSAEGLTLLDCAEFNRMSRARGWRRQKHVADSLHFEGDETEKAMMYCGHAFSYGAMNSYLQQCVKTSATDMYITCPTCRLELEPAQCVEIANSGSSDEKEEVVTLSEIEEVLTMRAIINDMENLGLEIMLPTAPAVTSFSSSALLVDSK